MHLPRTWAWPVLLVSAVLEAVWANALSASESFSNTGPTVLFLITVILSTVGLGLAMNHIPTGTAYAVWTSLGAVLTVGWSTLMGDEEMSWLKALFLAGIIACVVGLKRMDGVRPPGEDVDLAR